MVGAHITTLDLVGSAWAAPVEWKVTVDSQWDENYGAENVVSKDGVWHSSDPPSKRFRIEGGFGAHGRGPGGAKATTRGGWCATAARHLPH